MTFLGGGYIYFLAGIGVVFVSCAIVLAIIMYLTTRRDNND